MDVLDVLLEQTQTEDAHFTFFKCSKYCSFGQNKLFGIFTHFKLGILHAAGDCSVTED